MPCSILLQTALTLLNRGGLRLWVTGRFSMLWFVLLAVLVLIVCLGVSVMRRGSQGDRRPSDVGLGDSRHGDNRLSKFTPGTGGL